METRDIIKAVIKKFTSDPVLIAAWVLAFVSMFFVHPDAGYASYIDWRSLGILWSLMVVIGGFRANALFEKAGGALLKRVRSSLQLAAMLVFLCFFTAMLITNDVALITFVPFAMLLLSQSGREDLVIPVVALQTVAANLGSMLTPLGNPQNLYLYGLTGMSIGEFMGTMLPLTLLSFALLIVSLLLLPGRKKAFSADPKAEVVRQFGHRYQIVIYTVLFALSLCTVLRLVPWYVTAAAVFATVMIMDRHVVFGADYGLLLTFIGFFIFTGNIGRVGWISEALGNIVSGHEFASAVVSSQVISNVPATLLLSGFASDFKALLQGVNVGGLGTLIASMASLISYKALANAYPQKKGRYFLIFTVFNIAFLAILCLAKAVLG